MREILEQAPEGLDAGITTGLHNLLCVRVPGKDVENDIMIPSALVYKVMALQ